MARLYSRLQGRKSREIVYLDESFHGTFIGSMNLSGSIPMKEITGPLLPGISAIPTPNSLSCPAGTSMVDFALSCAEALAEKAAGGDVAAFILFHGSTCNGHPACCAAALANLNVMRRKGLVERATEM